VTKAARTNWKNYRLFALPRVAFSFVLFWSPSKSNFRLNHPIKVRKSCSHSIFSSQIFRTRNVASCHIMLMIFGCHGRPLLLVVFTQALDQPRSQSFVPLDQRSGNESFGSIHFEITKEITEFCPSDYTASAQSASVVSMAHVWNGCSQGPELPELSFSDRWSRGT